MAIRNCIVAAVLVASASAFSPMGVLPCSRARAASLQLRKPAGALHMAGGPPASVVKMLDFQSKVMGVVYKIQGKEKPFTLQMRDEAMALHTFSQAPREGKVRDETADTVVSPIPGPGCAPSPWCPPQSAGASPASARFPAPFNRDVQCHSTRCAHSFSPWSRWAGGAMGGVTIGVHAVPG